MAGEVRIGKNRSTQANCVATASSPSGNCVATASSPAGNCVATASSPSGCAGSSTAGTPSLRSFPGEWLLGVETARGNHLPHWTAERAIYHVCFRLVDSVPEARRREWEEDRNSFVAKRKAGQNLSADEIARLRYLYSEKIEKFLDSGHGSCLLRSDGVLAVVRETIFYNDGKTYRIHAYGVMPNHIHVCVEIFVKQDMAKVVQAWKSTLAHRINRLLGRTGELWQSDYYNHIIRTAKEYAFQMKYISGNDGVEGWRFDGGELRSDGVLAVGVGREFDGGELRSDGVPAVGVSREFDGGDAVATQGGADGGDAVATH